MKRYILFFVSLLLLASGCGKDDTTPVRPIPEEYRGVTLHALASRSVADEHWIELDTTEIYISEDGKTFSFSLNGEGGHQGTIRSLSSGENQTIEFISDEGLFEQKVSVISRDANHILGTVGEGDQQEEWLFVVSGENVTGLVVNDVALPLSGAKVVVNSNGSRLGVIESNDYGFFGVDNQMDGFSELATVSEIVVLKEGFSDNDQVVQVGSQYVVEMQEGQSGLNFGTVYGYVKDVETEEPLADIALSYGAGTNIVYTNQEGYYEMQVPVTADKVFTLNENFEIVEKAVSLESLEQVQVDFSLLELGSRVSGNIIDVKGDGVGGVKVLCKNKFGAIVASSISGVDGSFEFEFIPDEVYLISARLQGMQFIPGQQLIPVLGENVSGVKFKGIADGTTGVGGKITQSADNNPIEGVKVSCGSTTTFTDSNGYYLMEVEETGSSVMVAEMDGYMPRFMEVNVSSGQLTNGNMSMAPPSSGVSYTLYGKIMNEQSSPVVGATVSTLNGGQTISDASGVYSIQVQVYDEGQQYLMVSCEKTGYNPFSGFFLISPQAVSAINLYLQSQ